MARLAEGECSASECSLIGNDYWSAGYGRIIMVPRVKLAYDKVRRLSTTDSVGLPSHRGRPNANTDAHSARDNCDRLQGLITCDVSRGRTRSDSSPKGYGDLAIWRARDGPTD